MTDAIPGSSAAKPSPGTPPPATPRPALPVEGETAGAGAGASASPAAPAAPTLTYEPAGPAAKVTARHVRWGMLVAGAWLVGVVLLYNPLVELWEPLGVGLFGTPVAAFDMSQGDAALRMQGLLATAAYLGAMLVAQALFLLPRGPLAFRLADRGRPMRRALVLAVCAGMVAMLLTAGLVATLLDWPGWWAGVTLYDSTGAPASRWPRALLWVWLAMLLIWAGWAWVFFRYARDRDHRTAAARITRALLAGTVLELLVSGPAHVWAVRKQSAGLFDHDCYCARGSYTGLVFGCTALVWLFGPGVFLLVLREKRRREEIAAPSA